MRGKGLTREGLSRSEKVIGIFRKDGWVGVVRQMVGVGKRDQ